MYWSTDCLSNPHSCYLDCCSILLTGFLTSGLFFSLAVSFLVTWALSCLFSVPSPACHLVAFHEHLFCCLALEEKQSIALNYAQLGSIILVCTWLIILTHAQEIFVSWLNKLTRSEMPSLRTRTNFYLFWISYASVNGCWVHTHYSVNTYEIGWLARKPINSRCISSFPIFASLKYKHGMATAPQLLLDLPWALGAILRNYHV